ncbi:MAG: hypothetical protein CVU41_09515 [Chloroflexi bacterium HGW-Chloroflexi-3]|nr:MAG: hypothetical protein CVU41_09515 [Chloroflexi bacterium HGW-Chloroflexi-3]
MPKLDKNTITISSINAESDEIAYWYSKTPQERMEAIEVMRQIIYGYDPATTRLQRVLEITEQA